MFKTFACAMAVAVVSAWDMPAIFNGAIEPATWNSYLGADALNGVGRIIGEFNLGAMTAMQSDPNATTTTCFEKAEGTSNLFAKLFDTSDPADESTILDKINVL